LAEDSSRPVAVLLTKDVLGKRWWGRKVVGSCNATFRQISKRSWPERYNFRCDRSTFLESLKTHWRPTARPPDYSDWVSILRRF